MQDWLDKAIEHGEREFPSEACGLVLEKEGQAIYVPCRNKAENKEQHFILDPEDWARAEDQGKILRIVHTHPGQPPNPSHADKAQIEEHGLPWTIISIPSKRTYHLEPEGWEAPYVGRQFSFGILDCYTLIRDYYRRELGIELNNYERKNLFWERGENLYEENFEKENFVEVSDFKKHDLLLMAARSKIVNHAAIFLGYRSFRSMSDVPVILHHVQDRLSEETVFGGFWLKCLRKIIRHRSLL